MGKNSILKKHHQKFLELVLKEPYILKRFYWTGGTVLSEFYLQHRESEDIDLFSENQEIHVPSINKFVAIAGKKLGAKRIVFKRFLGLYTYILKLPKSELKVDFNYYPFPRINKGSKWKELEIDSLEDIAANKIHTIYTQARDRDFVDLFFIMKNKNFDLKKMILLAKAKFDWHIDPIQLGQAFTQVVALKDVPKMLVSFDRDEMEKFFLNEAKKLSAGIFKKDKQ
ncbi:MAG: nucleotidyl transferase AbiEii/AbiGii toxin family protein [bacterium]|nr:nucleotidyl transferase AbiEii/AbiGii toxin family protein [bacterium]